MEWEARFELTWERRLTHEEGKGTSMREESDGSN
jgi:hypothetical protein